MAPPDSASTTESDRAPSASPAKIANGGHEGNPENSDGGYRGWAVAIRRTERDGFRHFGAS